MKSIFRLSIKFVAQIICAILFFSGHAQSNITYTAIKNFKKISVPNFTGYANDPAHKALMIVSSVATNQDKWAAAEVVFTGPDSVYEIKLTALNEIDGESSFKVSVNGVQIGPTFQNPFLNLDATKDYAEEIHIIKNQTLHHGDTIRVESNCVTNGKKKLGSVILDHSRGRWKKLDLVPTAIFNSLLITKQPVNIGIIVGDKVEFQTKATGPDTITYRWRKYGDTTTIGTDSILSFTPTLLESGNQYFCILSNGKAVDSTRKALLTVSHESCRISFNFDQDTVNISEGKVLQIIGQTACSQVNYWSIVSGPAPRILDPEFKALEFTTARVTEPTLLIYKFAAVIGSLQLNKNIAVRIFDSIPDPLVSLPPSFNWNGKGTMVLRPTLTNKASLDASNIRPPINYSWIIPEVFTDTLQDRDSLTLSKPTKSGRFNISLCVDNGGQKNCVTTSINTSIPTFLVTEKDRRLVQPILITANNLIWTAPAFIRIWDLSGRILWMRNGMKGHCAKFPFAVYKSLLQHQAHVEIHSETIR